MLHGSVAAMFPTEKATQPALLDLSNPAPAPDSGKHDSQAGSREAPGEKHPRNQLNELTGQEWVYFTRSVLTTTYSSAYGHQLRKAHGANKPPELMKEFIEFFTRAGEVVLDPFAGVGGTLIGASIAAPPRRAIGIEINPCWAETYGEVIAASAGELTAHPMLVGDCREVLRDRERFADESMDYVLTDPPYNVHLPQTMSNAPRYRERHTNRRTDARTTTCARMRPGTWQISAATRTTYRRCKQSCACAIACCGPGAISRSSSATPIRTALHLYARRGRATRRGSRVRHQGGARLVSGRHAPTPLRIPVQLRAQHRPPAHRHVSEAAAAQPARPPAAAHRPSS